MLSIIQFKQKEKHIPVPMAFIGLLKDVWNVSQLQMVTANVTQLMAAIKLYAMRDISQLIILILVDINHLDVQLSDKIMIIMLWYVLHALQAIL